MSFKKRLSENAMVVNNYLATCLDSIDMPEGLKQAMNYSLQAGGKRLRPVLCLTTAELFGLTCNDVLPFAAAIECIHTYSLIHDDLPAMDNDDLRRGKPTSHKMFGEATAILAGDALLTDAFVFMCRSGNNGSIKPDLLLQAIEELALAAGSHGMVGGQHLDMVYTEAGNAGIDEIVSMHAKKTGALLTASCSCGAILAGADPRDIQNMLKFGKSFGAAFQITDDILDVIGDEKDLGKPVGSDEEQGKITYPSLLGLEESRRRAEFYVSDAIAALTDYASEPAAFLTSMARYVLERSY